MVDFPEDYGFAPGTKAKLMQPAFLVDIGVFTRKEDGRAKVRRHPDRSPYEFQAVGFVRKEDDETPIRGTLFADSTGVLVTPIEGTLQQVVTALCTLHRMRGNMK